MRSVQHGLCAEGPCAISSNGRYMISNTRDRLTDRLRKNTVIAKKTEEAGGHGSRFESGWRENV